MIHNLTLIIFSKILLSFIQSTFLVVGSQSITFKGKYSVAVASLGYKHPETLNIKISGKNNSEIIYKHCKNVTLKNNALEKVDFDVSKVYFKLQSISNIFYFSQLRDQIPGNYFIKVKGRSFEQTARLNLNTKMYSVLVQTDKAVYKPGDKVQFRVLILDSETKPLSFVTFTEALTGMQRAAYVYIYDFMYLNIQLIGETYLIKPGFLYTIRAYLKDIFETPVTDDREPVTFTVTYTIDNSNITDGPLTTTSSWEWKRPPSEVKIFKKFFKNGLAELPISITSNVTSITIYASYKGSIGYYLAKTRRTRSNQYIEIKIPSDSLSINNVLKIEIKSTARVDQLNYIIIGRNKIAAIGQLKAFKPKLFKLNLQPSIEMTPSTYIIAFYVTSDGEVISDRKYLNFDDNLKNFVSIFFIRLELKI